MADTLPLTRRALLGAAAAACVPAFAQTHKRAGVQLYTVRDLILKRPLETLQAIADIGYREVEMLRNQVSCSRRISRNGLQPVSMHFETPLFTGNYKAWQHADMPAIEQASHSTCTHLAAHHGFRTSCSTISRRKSALASTSIALWPTS